MLFLLLVVTSFIIFASDGRGTWEDLDELRVREPSWEAWAKQKWEPPVIICLIFFARLTFTLSSCGSALVSAVLKRSGSALERARLSSSGFAWGRFNAMQSLQQTLENLTSLKLWQILHLWWQPVAFEAHCQWWGPSWLPQPARGETGDQCDEDQFWWFRQWHVGRWWWKF